MTGKEGSLCNSNSKKLCQLVSQVSEAAAAVRVRRTKSSVGKCSKLAIFTDPIEQISRDQNFLKFYKTLK